MKADVVIATVIAVAGSMAIGQAILTGTSEPISEPPPKCSTYAPLPASDRPVTFAVAGDTVTAWKSPTGMRPDSWVTYADEGRVELVGGFAKEGVGTAVIADKVRPVKADVLVILTGTNDIQYPFNSDDIELTLQRTVDRVAAKLVLLSSIPPVPNLPEETVEFNNWLASVAYRHNWSFVDAGSSVRAGDCEFVPALTSDGTRTTPQGARLIGEAIRAALTNRKTFSPDQRG